MGRGGTCVVLGVAAHQGVHAGGVVSLVHIQLVHAATPVPGQPAKAAGCIPGAVRKTGC